MGSFIHYCKYCNAKLNVDDAWRGKAMKCPACSKKINFPEAEDFSDSDFPTAPDIEDASDIPAPPDWLPPPPQMKSGAPEDAQQIRINLKRNDKKMNTGDDFPPPPEAPAPPKEKPKLKIADNADKSQPQGNGCDNNKAAEPVPLRAVEPLKTVVGGAEKRYFSGTYFWGRLGSASVYVLAVLALLAGGYFSWHIYMDYRAAEELIPEKSALAAVNKELNERENKLSIQFRNAVSLLQGTGAINADGVLDGMVFGEDICLRPDPMPLGVLSSRELKRAQQVLEQYKQSNKKIKAEFINSFGRLGPFRRRSPAATPVLNNSNRIVVQAGELKQRFYINENYKKSVLKSLENTVQSIKQNLHSANIEQQNFFKRFEAATSFVRKQLFQNDNNITIVNTSRPASASAAGKASGELDRAAELIGQMADGWQLDQEISDMEMLLKKVPVLTEVYEKKRNVLLRGMGKEQVRLWLQTILLAFALLVLGDVLRAFFDKADILRRMGEKQ